jgi:hypothetical protein
VRKNLLVKACSVLSALVKLVFFRVILSDKGVGGRDEGKEPVRAASAAGIRAVTLNTQPVGSHVLSNVKTVRALRPIHPGDASQGLLNQSHARMERNVGKLAAFFHTQLDGPHVLWASFALNVNVPRYILP